MDPSPLPDYDNDGRDDEPLIALVPAHGADTFQQGLLGVESAAIEGELDLKRLDRAHVRRVCVSHLHLPIAP
jgi:hypothetical protein